MRSHAVTEMASSHRPSSRLSVWHGSSSGRAECVESECDDDLIIIEEDNLEALSRGTGMTPNEAWADAVAAMGPARARMFSSDADVEPVPGLGFGLGVD